MNTELLNAFNNGAKDGSIQVKLHKSSYEYESDKNKHLRIAYTSYFKSCVEKDKGIKRLVNKNKRQQAEIQRLQSIIKDMQQVDYVLVPQDKYCCVESWKKAKDDAWSKINFKLCKCDHNESCEHCFPPEFYRGGKWDLCKP